MNIEKYEKLKSKANLSLKILDLIAQGYSSQEIVVKTRANRQLVDYYQKAVKDEPQPEF